MLCSVTLMEELVDFLAAQVAVDVHLEAQFAEGAMDTLGVLLGSGPLPQPLPRPKPRLRPITPPLLPPPLPILLD